LGFGEGADDAVSEDNHDVGIGPGFERAGSADRSDCLSGFASGELNLVASHADEDFMLDHRLADGLGSGDLVNVGEPIVFSLGAAFFFSGPPGVVFGLFAVFDALFGGEVFGLAAFLVRGGFVRIGGGIAVKVGAAGESDGKNQRQDGFIHVWRLSAVIRSNRFKPSRPKSLLV
jgi:hypothetical protein